MKYPQRKSIRLKKYDYNTPGYYFITVCTRDRKKLFGDISVGNEFTAAMPVYSEWGRAVEAQLEYMKNFYENILLEKYVVMPNHVHLLLHVMAEGEEQVPAVSRFVGTLKRFSNKSCGENLWQNRSFDHVVRNEADFRRIWEYIDSNPTRWTEDTLYVE